MSYCVNCGVELDASATKCPLCDTPVYNPKAPEPATQPSPFPKEKGEELLVKFGIGRKKPARWTEKQKEGIRKTLKEVQSWTQLAEMWMEKYLKVE